MHKDIPFELAQADYQETEEWARKLFPNEKESDFEARMRLSFQVGCLKAKLIELHRKIYEMPKV